MNIVQIENLRTIVDLQYPHICVNFDDLKQFLNIPQEWKSFYAFKVRGNWYEKKGFFHNGKTTVWATTGIKQNHIRIANKEIPTLANGANWSHDFSFEKEGGANIIQRMMKLKAFW
ncbi:MAG: hypothetical protein ACREBJ_00160 [Nitrosotalea sp.]